MSNKVENMNTTAPSSTTASAKKPTRKLIVRQTLTSKLRAERGDKLQFIKNEIRKIEEKKEKLNAASKECVKTDDKFKKPNPVNNFKTPSHRPPISTTRTAPVSRNDKTSVTYKTVTTKLLNNNKPLEKVTKIRPSTAPTTSVNNNLKRPVQQKDIKTPKFSSVSNQIRQSLTSKFNQDKDKLPVNEKPRRQTVLFPTKKPEIKKSIPPKSALKTVGSTSDIKKCVTVKSPVRKSLSAIHLKKVPKCNRNSTIHRTVSWSHGLSPISQSPQEEPMFRTPTMAKRRSVFVQTPMSLDRKTNSPYPFSIISNPTTSELKRRLSLWLEKRGKPLDSFHHLRCFGIQSGTVIEEENKENFEVYIPDINSSYEDLKIKVEEKPEKSDKEEMSIANDAMYDLHKLILEKYPREQCEAWLEIIVCRFPEVQEKPQYWECRAALEEARGNYKNAIDCYSNAISKGAEVEKVNDPLDNLLEKFSVLNISHVDSTPQKTPQKTLDARNVFKSSIICFAIQERDRKSITEDGCRFTATPVRRSTRQSRSHFVTTPKVKLSTTLQDLEDPVHFQTNKGFQ